MNDLSEIKDRNTRVAVDKAWEQSRIRRGIIALGTYVIIGGYLNYLGIDKAWLHAAVPVIAYMASTLTLPVFKMFWVNKIYRESEVE